MNKNTINIGIPSKGRLKNDTLNIFKKKKLRIYSERGERDLFGYIKKSNIKIILANDLSDAAKKIVEVTK